MTCYTATATAHIKGGMPVAVSGSIFSDSDGTDLTDIAVCWQSSGKPVTKAFLASLSPSDWDSIETALFDA